MVYVSPPHFGPEAGTGTGGIRGGAEDIKDLFPLFLKKDVKPDTLPPQP
jgi:hypothetical protein